MSSKKRDSRLGTGLDALFGTDVASVLEDIENSSAGTRSSGTRLSIPIDQITPNPYQPRQDFDPDRLQELAASIREHGVFTPILVRRSLSGWQLIAGERRLRAARLAGLTEIPAIAVEFNDEQMMEISLLENIQRENLNPIEEAQGYQQLMDKMHYTQQQLSDKIGKSREYIANMLRLLKLPAQTQNLLAQQKLTPGQVRPLITLGSPETIDTLAARIAKEGLSARQVETLVRSIRQPAPQNPRRQPEAADRDLLAVQDRLQDRLQTKVRLAGHTMTIYYDDTADLNRILELIGYDDEP